MNVGGEKGSSFSCWWSITLDFHPYVGLASAEASRSSSTVEIAKVNTLCFCNKSFSLKNQSQPSTNTTPRLRVPEQDGSVSSCCAGGPDLWPPLEWGGGENQTRLWYKTTTRDSDRLLLEFDFLGQILWQICRQVKEPNCSKICCYNCYSC